MSKSACHEGTTGQDLSPSRCFQRSYEPHLVACHTVNPKNSKLPTEKLTAGIRENQTVPVIRIKIAGNYHKMLMDVMYIYIYNRYDFYAFASLHAWETLCLCAGPDFCHIFSDFKWPVFHMAMIGLRPRSAVRLSPNRQSFPPPNMPAPSCLVKLDSDVSTDFGTKSASWNQFSVLHMYVCVYIYIVIYIYR